MAKKLTVKIVGDTEGIITDENGKTYEVVTSFHARRNDGEYKYHEIYVYLNKLDEFKDEFKAPKTLRQKWLQHDDGTWESLGKVKNLKVAGYTETFGRTSNRAAVNLDEMIFAE